MQRDDKSRKEWADGIRKSLMVTGLDKVTKTIDAIRVESGSGESQSRLSRPGQWDVDLGQTPFTNAILRAGLEIEFEPNEEGIVEQVTFRLNETWRGVQHRFARTNAP